MRNLGIGFTFGMLFFSGLHVFAMRAAKETHDREIMASMTAHRQDLMSCVGSLQSANDALRRCSR